MESVERLCSSFHVGVPVVHGVRNSVLFFSVVVVAHLTSSRGSCSHSVGCCALFLVGGSCCCGWLLLLLFFFFPVLCCCCCRFGWCVCVLVRFVSFS